MTDVIDLYNYAESQGIGVFWFSMGRAESISYQAPDGDCYIAMDPRHLYTLANEKTRLAHEIGHCATGSFYNRYATCDIREKHEHRADKWAIEATVPWDELHNAIAEGHTEPWDLADYFGVTEDFIKKAICWYKYGNLAVDAYM